MGCEKAPPAPRKIDLFDLTIQHGILTHDAVIVNKSAEILDEIDAVVTVTYEDEIVKLERHWSRWNPGEAKTIGISAFRNLQSIDIEGTATSSSMQLFEDVAVQKKWFF